MSMTNYWAQFLSLLPKSPKLIGEVISRVHPTGDLYSIQLLGGGLMQVRSVTFVANNSWVFVQNGQVIALAPQRAPVAIDIA